MFAEQKSNNHTQVSILSSTYTTDHAMNVIKSRARRGYRRVLYDRISYGTTHQIFSDMWTMVWYGA